MSDSKSDDEGCRERERASEGSTQTHAHGHTQRERLNGHMRVNKHQSQKVDYG